MAPQGDIEAAIDEYMNQAIDGAIPNLAAIARAFRVQRSTLSRRVHGKSRPHQEYISETSKCLNNDQELVLIKRINYLTDKALPPTPQIVRNLAEEICGRELHRNWVGRFIIRHKSVLLSKYLRCIAHERIKAEYIPNFEHFYRLLYDQVEKFQLTPAMIYNMDEKGFIIGLCRATRRVFTRSAYISGRRLQALHDGNREFVSLLCCICADGTHLAPTLIYPSEGAQILNNWTQDLEEDDKLFMGCSNNGWSNNAFGLEWLKKAFIPAVRAIHGPRQHLLLILDGHSSHINLAFIEYANKARINLLILPPHTTHRLQPLDVGVFSPLSQYFSTQLDQFMARGQGLVRVSKAEFYRLFKPSFKQALSQENILGAFEKCGIWPFDPAKVTDKLQLDQPESSDEPSSIAAPASTALRTPRTSKSIRRFQNDYIKNPTKAKLEKLFSATTQLSAALDVSRAAEEGLCEAIKIQKRKKRGKKLNLDGSEDVGQALLWSDSQIRVAQARQEALAAEEQAIEAVKKDKKDAIEAKKQEEERTKAQRAVQRQLIKEARDEKKAEQRAQIDGRKAARAALKEARAGEKTHREPIQVEPPADDTNQSIQPTQELVSGQEGVVVTSLVQQVVLGGAADQAEGSRPRRNLNLPQRFKL